MGMVGLSFLLFPTYLFTTGATQQRSECQRWRGSVTLPGNLNYSQLLQSCLKTEQITKANTGKEELREDEEEQSTTDEVNGNIIRRSSVRQRTESVMFYGARALRLLV